MPNIFVVDQGLLEKPKTQIPHFSIFFKFKFFWDFKGFLDKVGQKSGGWYGYFRNVYEWKPFSFLLDVALVMQYLVCHILRAISMVRVCAEDWLHLVLVKLRILLNNLQKDGHQYHDRQILWEYEAPSHPQFLAD